MGASGQFMSSVMQAAASTDPAAPPGTQAPPQPPPPSPVQQAQNVQQQIPADHASAAGSPDNPRPVGFKAQQSQEASPKEQAEYAQLVLRFQNYISDTKVHNPHVGSTSAAVMKQLNDPKKNIPQAVGDATAQAIYVLWRAARAQKVDYSPDVMFHAADECNALMYLKGLAAGIFKGTPPFDTDWLHGDKHAPYPFKPLEIHIIASAKIFAVRHFGKLEQQMGDITPQARQQAMAFWREQVQKEISEGKVSDATVKQLMGSPQVRAALGQQVANAQPAPQPQAPSPPPPPQPAAPQPQTQQPAPQ